MSQEQKKITHVVLVNLSGDIDAMPATSEEDALAQLRERATFWMDGDGVDTETATLKQIDRAYREDDDPETTWIKIVPVFVMYQPTVR